ncbi:RNA polymerase sigma factor [Dictyobacter kobayashii]|uniref:RNA polymerase sigma factor n=1 Tax=Dictyobacter kobayashii TaxID=2014872 RepID=A0A402AKV1_9CHLR|nr:sigma-70 family RNA polymerase sigma factor [Dictyobacter kobayashii]GCE19757.1 DNA-directed RNA polymerase sigma-70 factor [Dictyobacter kobayashii]
MWGFKRAHAAQNSSSDRLILRSNEIEDEVVVQAITSGAMWAMEVLYDRYSRILYSFAYRMVSDHQVAEDLLQEAFMAVWKRSVTYSRQAGTVRSWLFSIMHHRAIDYLRSVKRRAVFSEVTLDEADQDERVALHDTWDEVWRSVQSHQVREALMSLSTEQRLVIELAYFQGWTHSEIADGCHLPLGTVKARMRLGLIHLKRALENMGVHEL